MTDFLQQLIIGLRLGSVYALVALGYTMVYGIIRLINFAHGDFIMVGGYTLYFTVPILLHSMGLPAWTGVLAAIVICALVGVVVELVAYRPVRRKGTSMSALITAIAMSLLLENLAQAIPAMGPNPRVISDEIFSTAPISIGGVSVNMAAVVTIIIAAVVMAALQLFVQKTKLAAPCAPCPRTRRRPHLWHQCQPHDRDDVCHRLGACGSCGADVLRAVSHRDDDNGVHAGPQGVRCSRHGRIG